MWVLLEMLILVIGKDDHDVGLVTSEDFAATERKNRNDKREDGVHGVALSLARERSRTFQYWSAGTVRVVPAGLDCGRVRTPNAHPP